MVGLEFMMNNTLLVRLTARHLEAFRLDGGSGTFSKSATLPALDGSGRTMAAAPDGRRLAVATDQGVRVWDMDTLKPTGELFGERDVTALAYSPDGRLLIAAAGRFVQAYDAITLKPFTPTAFAVRDRVARIEAYPQPGGGFRLATADDEGAVTFFEFDAARRLTEKARPVAHAEKVLALSASHDGRTLASASLDQTLKLWDPLSGLERATLNGGAEAVVFAEFLPDDRALVSVSRDGVVRFWLR